MKNKNKSKKKIKKETIIKMKQEINLSIASSDTFIRGNSSMKIEYTINLENIYRKII